MLRLYISKLLRRILCLPVVYDTPAMSVLRSVSDAVAFQASVFNSSSVHGKLVHQDPSSISVPLPVVLYGIVLSQMRDFPFVTSNKSPCIPITTPAADH